VMEKAAIEAMESEHDFFVSMDMLVCEMKHLGIRCDIPFSFCDLTSRGKFNRGGEVYGRSPVIEFYKELKELTSVEDRSLELLGDPKAIQD